MKKNKKKNRKILLGIIILVLFLCVWNTYSLLKDMPRPERISDRNVIESTKIYDRTSKILLYEIHGEEKRTVIPLQNIPDFVKNAALAAEDISFYQHSGIDWRGIARAILNDLRQGNLSQGGSTITQQLIKNSLLGPEKTFRRKIREQILAIWLEQKYSKDQILEMYLNQIPYGSNAYGVESASLTYFGKSVKDLNINEAATLAALPKAPSFYSPYGSQKEELYKRKNWVLNQMADARFITKIQAEEAKASVLTFQPIRDSIKAPHFVMYVRDYLNNKYGESFVEQGGLKVTTTLDWNFQEEAEKIIKEGVEKNKNTVGASNAALVAIDPKSGEILSMVGSKSYWEKSDPEGCNPGINCKFDPHVNVTTRLRQPGSSFKPFIYATAFSKGYTPDTVLFDVLTEFNPNCRPDGTQIHASNSQFGDCYNPQNYDGKYRGPVTLRQAIAQSLNVPAVKLLYLVGIKDSIQTAKNLGITSLNDPDKYGLSLVLGGAEVSLLEMTSAFGVFAQEGILHPKVAILKIEDAKGNILEEKKDEATPVLDTEVARNINNVLSDNEARVPAFNLHSSLYFPDRQVAVKTGTTQESRDAWIVGYTPSLSVGVWAGNNNNEPMNKSSLSVIVAGPMWHNFVDFVLKNYPPEGFIPPENKKAEKPVLRGLYRSGDIIKIDKITKKLATSFTPSELIEEIRTGDIKTILTQIKKEDPTGDLPTNPENDPQYENWQWAINYWLSKNYLPQISIPQDFDNIHSPDKIPKITFIYPNTDTVNNLSKITLQLSYTYSPKQLDLFIDDELIDSKTSVSINYLNDFELPRPLSIGNHTLKVILYDIIGNKVIIEKNIGVNH